MHRAHLSHVFLYCFDLQKMIDFYTGVVGFRQSDRGEFHGRDICFLTLDPDADHHQLALCGGRTGPAEGGPLNHIAFRVDSIAELRRRHLSMSTEHRVNGVETTSHGSWLSLYYRDAENNRMEFFFDTPWYVQQPVVEGLDLAQSDAQILEGIEARHGTSAGFALMAEWKREKMRALTA